LGWALEGEGYQEKKKTNTKKTKFWETYFGMGKGRRLSNALFFVFFGRQQIADG